MPRIKITYTAAQLAEIERQKQLRKINNRAKRKALKAALNNSGWKKFEGVQLPPQARVHNSQYREEATNIFEYGGNWVIGWTYYKGNNPETATEWIVVTNNGGFYKVDAEYMLWHIPSGTVQALWSNAAVKKSLKSLMLTGNTVRDPDYQT